MTKLSCIASSLLLAMAVVPAWAQNVPVTPTSTTASPKVVHLTKAQTIYHDVDGKVIDKTRFAEGRRTGQQFSIKLSPDRKKVILSLLPPGVAGTVTATTRLHIAPGQPLPDFGLPTLAGSKASAAGLQGKPTLVDLFFAQCVACIEELPALNTFMARHPEMNYLAITFDDARTAKGFVDKYKFAWPVAYAGGNYLNKKLGVSVYPTLLLLDAKGRLRASRSGSVSIQSNPPPVSAASSGTRPDMVVMRSAPTHPAAAEPDPAATKQQLQDLEQWVHKHLDSAPH